MAKKDTIIEKVNVTKVKVNFFLDGRELLHQDEISTEFQVEREKFIDTGGIKTVISENQISTRQKILNKYPLSKVTIEQLAQLRRSDKPGFVLKERGEYYYAQIDSECKFNAENILGLHRCAIVNKECRRLSAAFDNQGGCAKVRGHASNIERYDFITLGYETFNTEQDCLVVINCLNYECSLPRKKHSPKEISKAKESLEYLFKNRS